MLCRMHCMSRACAVPSTDASVASRKVLSSTATVVHPVAATGAVPVYTNCMCEHGLPGVDYELYYGLAQLCAAAS